MTFTCSSGYSQTTIKMNQDDMYYYLIQNLCKYNRSFQTPELSKRKNNKVKCTLGFRKSLQSKLAALAYVTNVKRALHGQIMLLQCLFQPPRWLQHVFLRQYPRTPVYTERTLAFGILEDIDGIVRVCVHGAHHPSRIVRADRDQAKVKGAAELANLFKGRADRKVIFGGVVVGDALEVRNSSVAGVSVARINLNHFV